MCFVLINCVRLNLLGACLYTISFTRRCIMKYNVTQTYHIYSSFGQFDSYVGAERDGAPYAGDRSGK